MEENKMLKIIKIVGIVLAIAIFGLGVTIFLSPVTSSVLINNLFIIGIGIYGLVQIFEFVKFKEKSSMNLTIGIISIIICLLTLFDSDFIKASMIAYIFGFILLSKGISQIVVSLKAKKSGFEDTIWITIAGTISTIVAILFILFPVAFEVVYTLILGVYLIVSSIALLFEIISLKD
ncbi:MAG: DUF308 domain-containing protein [Clostridia bacterium]